MKSLQKIGVLVGLIIMLTANALAVLLPLNGKSTGELSDAIPIYFVPEGYVFSIWSIIYLALIGYVVYQIMPKVRDNKKLHSIAWLFIINALANSGWIFLWHYEYVATSVLLMLVLLVTLILIYLKLEIGRSHISKAEYWLTHFPFSLYLGWISVATIANIAGALHVHEWGAWGIAPQTWSVIMLVVAAALTLVMLLRHRDYVFAGVIIWAVLGIGKNFSDVESIYLASISVVAAVVGMICVSLVKSFLEAKKNDTQTSRN